MYPLDLLWPCYLHHIASLGPPVTVPPSDLLCKIKIHRRSTGTQQVQILFCYLTCKVHTGGPFSDLIRPFWFLPLMISIGVPVADLGGAHRPHVRPPAQSQAHFVGLFKSFKTSPIACQNRSSGSKVTGFSTQNPPETPNLPLIFFNFPVVHPPCLGRWIRH